MASIINLKIFERFFKTNSNSGIVLLLCLVVSLLAANSPVGPTFEKLLHLELGVQTNFVSLRLSTTHWINDGFMAVFFLLVGLEIKRELKEGELSSIKEASLPVLAAIGGAVFPALIFYCFNSAFSTATGWGIPMATDIAFAIAILSLLGSKVPPSLKIFLSALAIVDDLIAILVIAVFYSSGIQWEFLLYGGTMFAIQLIFNKLNLKNLLFYIVPGMFMWYFIHHSGIHATIAGVLTAFTVPTTQDDVESPLEKLEHLLTIPVSFVIMPIFALANTNIHISSEMFYGLKSELGMGIIFGLLLGKPLGITMTSWLAVKFRIGKLPSQSNIAHILGLGILGGIGFTMSIFIALLSFDDASAQLQAKFAILVASILSGIGGYFLLSWSSKKRKLRVTS